MKRRVWIGFTALCLLSGSRWLLDAALPSPIEPVLRQALHSLLLLPLFALFAIRKRKSYKLAIHDTGCLIAWSTLLFALPLIVLDMAEGKLPSLTISLVLMLGPAMVVFITAQRSSAFGMDNQSDPRRLLTPALMGLFGAGLLFPLVLPGTFSGKIWAGAVVLAVFGSAFAAVNLHRLLGRLPLFQVATIVSATILLEEGVAGMLLPHAPIAMTTLQGLTEAGMAIGYDAPILLLSLWLLRAMPPTSYAARTFTVLLLALIESATLMRPTIPWTTWLGMSLLALASAWLLTARVPDEQ